MNHRTLFVTLLLALAAAAFAQATERPVLEIVARGHAFELSTQRIPSGWTTIRLHNESAEPHFAIFERLPLGRTMADTVREVLPPFQEAMDLIMAGEVDAGFAALGTLPEWFGEVVFTGGPGMVSPGGTTEVVAFLEPGTYVIECYVKTEDGVFHSVLGMLEELTVTDDSHDAAAPQADLVITPWNPEPDDGSNPQSGFAVEGAVEVGRQVIEVRFDAENPPLLGNDVHLVRLQDGQDMAEVAAWMDWTQPDGMRTPAPALFVGGTNEMPRGQSAYLTVDLEPGRYAWVSERGATMPMYLEFEVR